MDKCSKCNRKFGFIVTTRMYVEREYDPYMYAQGKFVDSNPDFSFEPLIKCLWCLHEESLSQFNKKEVQYG